jgi:hypothetical protein
MKTTWIIASVMTLIVGFASAASAQTYVPQGPIGFGYYGGYRHASTYEEGVLRGYADFTRAHGESDYWHSLAGINRQVEYQKYLENRQLKTETYFRNRAINSEARQPVRLSTEQLAVLAKKQAPDRLNGQQYDRTLGRLSWPAVLTGDEFQADRAILDAAFAARTPGDTGVSSSFSNGVRELTNEMQARLKAQMGSMSQMEYLAAKKFLTGLALEAQQPLVVEALAVAE